MNGPKIRTIAFGVLAGVVASTGTAAVTAAGFALSYDAIRAVGIASRIRAELGWLLPVSVDGAMAVGTIAAVVLRRMSGRTAWYPWAVVLIGAAISIACNGLHAIPPAGAALVIEEQEIRFAVSAIPAVMLALSVHLLVTLVEAASVTGGASGASPGHSDASAMARAALVTRHCAAPVDAADALADASSSIVAVTASGASPAGASAAPIGGATASPQVARLTQPDALPRRTREVVMRRPVSAPPADRDAAMTQALDAVLRRGASIRGAARDADVPEATLRREVTRRRELATSLN